MSMISRRFFRIINSIQKFDIWPIKFREKLVRLMGVRLGSGVTIFSGVDFIQGQIHIGDRVFINRDVLIDGAGGVVIGAGVHIAPRCMLLTATHQIGDGGRRAGGSVAHPLHIGDAAWIGAAAVLLPGARVGVRTIVGAMALVRGELSDDALYLGVPARLARELSI